MVRICVPSILEPFVRRYWINVDRLEIHYDRSTKSWRYSVTCGEAREDVLKFLDLLAMRLRELDFDDVAQIIRLGINCATPTKLLSSIPYAIDDIIARAMLPLDQGAVRLGVVEVRVMGWRLDTRDLDWIASQLEVSVDYVGIALAEIAKITNVKLSTGNVYRARRVLAKMIMDPRYWKWYVRNAEKFVRAAEKARETNREMSEWDEVVHSIVAPAEKIKRGIYLDVAVFVLGNVIAVYSDSSMILYDGRIIEIYDKITLRKLLHLLVDGKLRARPELIVYLDRNEVVSPSCPWLPREEAMEFALSRAKSILECAERSHEYVPPELVLYLQSLSV